MKTMGRIVFIMCVSWVSLICQAQKPLSPYDVKLMTGKSPHEGRYCVTFIENLYNKDITVVFKNEVDGHETPVLVQKGEQKDDIDLTFTVAYAYTAQDPTPVKVFPYPKDTKANGVRASDKEKTEKDKKEKKELDQNEEKDTKAVKQEKDKEKEQDKSKEKEKGTEKDKTNEKEKGKTDDASKSKKEVKEENKDNKNKKDETKEQPETPQPPKITIRKEQVISDFLSVIDTIPVYSHEKIGEDSASIVGHLDNLRNWSDKAAYIKDKGIEEFIQSQKDTIESARNNDVVLLDNFLKRYDGKDLVERESCVAEMKSILSERLAAREKNLRLLEDELSEQLSSKAIDWKLIAVYAVSVILVIALLLWYRKTKKKQAHPVKKPDNTTSPTDAASLIVVRQRTAPTLKKQSLDDVYHNEAYLKIDCKDFCTDSCVRTMYIKNTCIKDIYNMYAEDLRNPANPKEDGCLVIGRWVQNTATNDYDVSLEYVILPGDDAVFTEYELNFGGKIQIKKADVLKRLRRDTGLQYDLTCWVHSHPGLGVFFSNSDNNVQMQLKQELHPNVLTAMVIDILTPNQETGIFTFKSDSTVNSKNDLTRMYSLEEMYRWALDSERRSFNKDDYYNALGNADRRIGECYGIELSNGAIIDMTYLTANQNGYVGLVHGYPIRQGDKMEYITTSVTKSEAVSDSEVIGCFVVAAHCSIPSIRKLMAQYLDKIKFVLVYTATDGLLTSIPVLSRDLCGSEDYYGENNLEELKIWTRRRR